DYHAALVRSGFDPGSLDIGYEHGKLNSTFIDNRFTIGQSFQFPTVYRNQKKLANANWEISKMSSGVLTLELQTGIKQVFYAMLVMEKRKEALQQADSIYAGFAARSENRLKQGETDALELATAQNLRLEITSQLKMLTRDQAVFQRRLQYLTGSATPWQPDAGSLLYTPQGGILTADSVNENNPLLQMRSAMIAQSDASLKLEKSKLLPSIGIGYANASFSGYQTLADGSEKYFGRSDRFQSLMLSVGIPLFRSAQHARIDASRILIRQQQTEKQAEQAALNTALDNAQKAYAFDLGLMQTYQKSLLPNSDIILQTAGNRLKSGDISYLEWVMLINQAIETKSKYYSIIEQLNESAIGIEKIAGTIY
ncbi:MAG: TolC family protein, partial [Chitinophagaceae bacterium]|nr:TolC family protein [Chitinophagaceae bacterium]